MHMSNYPHPMDDKVGFEAADEEIFGPSPFVRKCEQPTGARSSASKHGLPPCLVTIWCAAPHAAS